MEYALDLNPLAFNTLSEPVANAGGLLLSYSKGAAAAADSQITYAIESSATLTDTWTPLATVTNNSTQISAVIPANDPSGRRFGRLRVTKSN